MLRLCGEETRQVRISSVSEGTGGIWVKPLGSSVSTPASLEVFPSSPKDFELPGSAVYLSPSTTRFRRVFSTRAALALAQHGLTRNRLGDTTAIRWTVLSYQPTLNPFGTYSRAHSDIESAPGYAAFGISHPEPQNLTRVESLPSRKKTKRPSSPFILFAREKGRNGEEAGEVLYGSDEVSSSATRITEVSRSLLTAYRFQQETRKMMNFLRRPRTRQHDNLARSSMNSNEWTVDAQKVGIGSK
ncbi:unnamed protein product, partial [Nesidiocoris tenuis]